MIEKEIKEKTIQWIKLEREVMDTVLQKVIKSEEMTHSEWAKFFVDTVKEYGNKNMIEQLKFYVDYLVSVKSSYKIENDNIDEMFKNLSDLV